MGYRVLVVDDSKLARMAVAKALTTLPPDWTRVEAANADEALAFASKDAFDLGILDFNMPGHDGLHLAAELLKLKPALPLAVISANHQVGVARRAREAGSTCLAKALPEKAMAEFLDAAVCRLAAQ